MQVYLVGGAVRDELLGLPVRERDWVVVGGSPAALEAQGYRPVGRDFPVFLHPQSGEEYALARVERKSGPGYRGFVTGHSPDVTLEQDLQRRDLTVNAMARAGDGTLVDPYGGRADLDARVLRHVSPAFSEDPVRILRAARFLARFAPLGFSVAPATLALMRDMVAAGEVAALVPERVWRELERLLGEGAPGRGLQMLHECGALRLLAPQLAAALDRDAAGTLAPLARATQAGLEAAQRWAALVAPLGEAPAEALALGLRAPNEFRELAALTARVLTQLRPDAPDARDARDAPDARGAQAGPAEALLALFERCDALRRPARFSAALAAASQVAPAQATAFAELGVALARVAAVQLDAGELRALAGAQIGARLRELRLAALQPAALRGAG